MSDQTLVYVGLLDEAVDVWRPVAALRVSASAYQLSDVPVPEGESWEFQPGTVVMGEERYLDGQVRIIAIGAAGQAK